MIINEIQKNAKQLQKVRAMYREHKLYMLDLQNSLKISYDEFNLTYFDYENMIKEGMKKENDLKILLHSLISVREENVVSL